MNYYGIYSYSLNIWYAEILELGREFTIEYECHSVQSRPNTYQSTTTEYINSTIS